jgi:predicted lipoprotein
MRKIALIIIVFLFAGLLVDCKKKKTTEEEELEISFDKSGMLSNYSDNVIAPNFQLAKQALDSFALAYNDFIQNKTVSNLVVARQKFNRAYHQYQLISIFEFGPSENEIIRASFDTHPTDTVQILSNINTGSYNLALASNIDAKGLPALDYLLYGKNISDATVVTLFDTDVNAANRIAYFNACLSEMQTKLNTVINAWNAGYKNSFNSNTGSEIGSSLGLLVNQLNYEVDLMKNAKIGIPLGKKSLGVQLPEKCEAYYANTISVSLTKTCLATIENVYLGRSINGADGLGLDDYLDALDAQHNSGSLNNAIKNQFAVAKSKLALVNEPLSDAVINDMATVDAAYVQMVKLLVLLKTDMPSAMGIVITYQDGDGD